MKMPVVNTTPFLNFIILLWHVLLIGHYVTSLSNSLRRSIFGEPLIVPQSESQGSLGKPVQKCMSIQ